MTQESQIGMNITVYFVVPSKYKSKDDCTPDMHKAHNESLKIDVQSKWVAESECHKITPTKTDVFVMEEFEGDLFEELNGSKCSIIGPRCLTSSILDSQPIPLGSSPVYTTAMSGLCISVSGMTIEAKQRVKELVSYMGGFFTNQLRSSVNYLVTESVMSAKYETAAENKITIVTKEWVEAIWKASLTDFVKASDKMFDKYKAPVFLNLVVTSTNFSKTLKDEMKQLINDNGGIFMGALDGTKVKIVLAPANGPVSDKLKYAKQANIPCLTPDWVHASIKAGYAIPIKDYLIQSLKACSTPEKSAVHETFNCSSISCIPSDYQQRNCVEESLATTINNFSCTGSLPSASVSQGSTLDRLTLKEAKLAGPFLDGCNIYITGFTTSHKDKLNRILNVGGATRFDDISDALTHVIIGDEVKATGDLKIMKSKGLSPVLLTVEWLEESMKLKYPAPEENFLFELKNNISQQPVEPPSPLSKKNLQMLQKPRRPPIPAFNIDKKPAPAKKKAEPDFLQQYLAESTTAGKSDDSLSRTVAISNTSNADAEESGLKSKTLLMEPNNSRQSRIMMRGANPEESVVMSQLSTLNDNLFYGCTFVVTGFDSMQTEVLQTIMAFGGKIVPGSYAGIPDYGVVPIIGAPLRHTVNEIVTNLYIDDCVNQEAIINIEYYHRPLTLKKHSNPLTDCVITMSTYTGGERMYLTALASELGAKCQDIFARRTNAKKKTLGTTHLICRSPEGNKYNAAVNWKLPAVTADWLLQCAAELRRVDETPFLVGETVAPERPHSDNLVNGANFNGDESHMSGVLPDRPSRTPKRHFPALERSDASTPDTPLINKRLSLITHQTPESPFHVSTPESPYGQVFKANPSPATRKGWLKWTNDLLDLREKEPPLKPKTPSTPLSEVKRQLMQKVVQNARAMARDAMQNDPNGSFGLENGAATDIEARNCNENNDDDERMDKSPINRKLEYADENNAAKYNNINLEIMQLDQVLERTSTTPKSRCSLMSQTPPTENSDHTKGPVLDSQPLEAIGWEDPSHKKWSNKHKNVEQTSRKRISDESGSDTDIEGEQQECPKKIKFMLSCIQDRAAYENVIRNLGGDVSVDSNFDDTATHLLCTRPLRNEKMLSSIASGKWVLYCSYLRDSEREGKFLDEEQYEWGNPKSENNIPKPSNDTERAIARAAYRWRVRIQAVPRGPFHDMVALLLVSADKSDQFKRLIEAGGGEVVQARPPYDTTSSGRKITHCFVSLKQATQPIDWATLASKGILCFMPQYLHDHLTADTPCNPRECVAAMCQCTSVLSEFCFWEQRRPIKSPELREWSI